MKRTTTRVILGCLCAGGALGLACCGGDADDDPSTRDDAAPSVAESQDATGGSVEKGGSGGTIHQIGGSDVSEREATPSGGRSLSDESPPDDSDSTEDIELYARACPGIAYTPEMQASDTVSTCMQQAYSSEPVPVDVVIMMDRSISMDEPLPGQETTRWDGVRAAVQAFVQDPQVIERKIRMSIQFFGQTGGFAPEVDCDIANYSEPKVPMAPVAENGSEILAAIDAMMPSGQTPTLPALQGALLYAKSFTAKHGVGRAMAVVLVTDGLPTQCQDVLSVTKIANVAAEAYKYEPSVRTFVVGIGPALDNLNEIAYRGGTEKAFLIERGDAAAQFVDALKHIALSDLPCEFEVPRLTVPNQIMDYDLVRIHYTPDDQEPEVIQEIPALSDRNACFDNTLGGWYFDDPQSPTKIVACPCTCTLFRTGLIRIEYGCRPIPL